MFVGQDIAGGFSRMFGGRNDAYIYEPTEVVREKEQAHISL